MVGKINNFNKTIKMKNSNNFKKILKKTISKFNIIITLLKLSINGKIDVKEKDFKLGLMYDDGDGVERDYKKALKYYQKAANKGHIEAQYNLGMMYCNGKDIPKNETKGLEWFHKAAIKGHIEAQYNLGMMYCNGKGVSKNETKGLEWFHKAAEKDFYKAQYNLSVMYGKEWFKKAEKTKIRTKM